MSIRLPGEDGARKAAALALLEAAGRGGLSADDVERRLEERWPGADAAEVLGELQAEALAVEWSRRWMALRHTDWTGGVVQLLDRGDALIRTGEAGEAGYFVARRRLKGAGDGDLVLLQPVRRRRRAEGGRLPEAAVSKVLRRRLGALVGTLEIDGERRWLVPFDPKLKVEMDVEDGDELLEDQYVVVEPTVVPAGGGPSRGRVIEVLGSVETPGVDVEVILRHFRIPDEFPAGVLEDAAGHPADPAAADWRGREDLRQLTTVTIDGETARDFDDAITLEELPGGAFRLGVHIADVAHYVPEGSRLDLEAYRRGTSVYYPERAVPMLPEGLSNGLCSLRPEVPRLTLSVFLDLGPEGGIRRRRFAETVIQSDRRLTYGEVRRLLEQPAPGDAADYGPVLPLLETARRLMWRLHERRLARGSIDFDLPEGDVILDPEGFTVGVRPGERAVSHRIVEEFMIAANEAVAQELFGHETEALYRVHDPPSPRDLEELREILKPLGLALKGDLEDLHPSALQAVLRRVEGRAEEPFVSALVLRSMQRALYEPESRGHYALASRHYLHFTSPIRRYPDLVVHRRLKALLHGRAEAEAESSLLAERLPAIAEHASRTERRAEQSERELMQWKLVRFLAHRVGERFSGRISGVQPFGLFVQLDDYFVDGLVPIRSLADDFYRYDAEAHRLVGADRERVFQLADPVEVTLTGVSLRHRGLDLKISGMPEPEARGAGSRRDRRPRGRR